MSEYIPGTTIPLVNVVRSNPFELIDATLTMSGGLTLSQVSDITGLNSSTIQNWVKRGWVQSPKAKRYGETSLCRIMIINMLRGTMKLDEIIKLMAYINGKVDDRSDDIIPDRELFSLLCKIILDAEDTPVFDLRRIDGIVSNALSNYSSPDELSFDKLSRALRIMVLAYIGTQIKQRAEQLYNRLEL